VIVHPAAGPATTRIDHDDSFDQQVVYPVAPMFNPSGMTVDFGDSSLDEMCFSGLYWFPARDTSLLCLH
jgi:hypothetical protein